MRIRTIKPEFFTHEGIFETEAETGLPIRIAFAGLWCAADREGRFKWEPRRLGVQILPYDQVDFSRVLDALTTRGFIVRYTSDTGDFGVIPSFLRHQVINNRERASELPDPNDCKAFDASTTRQPRETHASKEEGKGKEGNKEGKGKELSPEAIEFSEWFKSTLPDQDQKTMENNWLANFCEAYEKLTRIDGYTPTEIRAVCKWAREDQFWSQNFKSPSKLRKRDSNKTLYWNVFSQRMKQSNQPAQKQLAIHHDPFNERQHLIDTMP
jgi:hypothetical protein